jgi:hypothetical protein
MRTARLLAAVNGVGVNSFVARFFLAPTGHHVAHRCAHGDKGAVMMVRYTSGLRFSSIFGLVFGGCVLASACTRDAQAITPEKLEQQYGIAGAYADTVTTPDGSIKGTIVPVTLADGRRAQLVIPSQTAKDPHSVYMRDGSGLHPVEVSERSSRHDVAQAPAVVETRPERAHSRKRSWEKEALIIGGSAGAGTAIGAVAGGRKGAAVGAAAGGVGGLIYDLATRDRDRN